MSPYLSLVSTTSKLIYTHHTEEPLLTSLISWESEGFDREHMKLPGLSDRLVSEVIKANPNTVVINQSGTPVEMPWESEAHTLLQVSTISKIVSGA